MDEKEMVYNIRESFSEGVSRAQVTQNLQTKGYKLEYIDALIKRAKRPKRILIYSVVFLIIILSLSIAIFSIINSPMFNSSSLPQDIRSIKNPLAGINVLFSTDDPIVDIDNQKENETVKNVALEDIEITPDFIAYLLVKIGAVDALHKNSITREPPMINFNFGPVEYTAELKENINITSGLNPKADIQFNSEKEQIVRAILSETPVVVFKDSISAGTTTIEKIAGDTELFAKGYLDFYNSLNE